ncbi:FAD-binding domain-containing protein [Mesobacterium sp. TK19101]|uniref:FAD-binding domain-containing protein n=1 Tax=Mesobacterium hydrothermale TaxID=3111907 RepID=A0ABU6HD74_9RHOB|nr:FAD-binding domain-containing protein [Mesobacterium sp. TK19101]MEC3860407.1 FAD-binding domain-containing protein [Mesobacterium sp. TK19101]
MTIGLAPTRTAALERLHDFLPRAGRYAADRNFDFGPGHHRSVSQLSPYLRHRLITEEEVLRAVLGRFSPKTVDKFLQEVFWRAYWKGWLEMRPGVWHAYRAGVLRALDRVQSEAGLRARWQAACSGTTGIDAFDHWARELADTGYLHNHARMWFASIWIFTLRLPWELGADFFLRHLLDGDPASNTLSWRWVAGLQTRGKHYVARSDNIARYTEGRFRPVGLEASPAPLSGADHPPRRALPAADGVAPGKPALLVLHEDDLHPGFLFDAGLSPVATVTLETTDAISPLVPSALLRAFKTGAMQDVTQRWADRLGPVAPAHTAAELLVLARAHGAQEIVTAYAPTGPVAEVLDRVTDLPVRRVRRPYDSAAWPHATHGFFRFKDHIPALLGQIV